MQCFGALGVEFHTCGVRAGIEDPQAGQPANGWRKDSNGRATFTAAMRKVSFRQVQGGKRQHAYRDRGDAGSRQSAVPRHVVRRRKRPCRRDHTTQGTEHPRLR